MLSGYRRIDNLDNAEQFSALAVRIPDGTRFITFRGTDDNIFAWKENFRMSIIDTIPAQEDALRYLRWAMDAYEGSFIVCGHSKGGNLAVYASSMLPQDLQDRIISVYSFDGPGFREDFLNLDGYRRILPKLHSLRDPSAAERPFLLPPPFCGSLSGGHFQDRTYRRPSGRNPN